MDRLRELNAGKRDPHLVGRWCIDQSLTDYSGRGRTASKVGSPFITQSSRGYAMDFNGTSDYLTLAKPYFTMPFSVSMWVYCRNTTDVHQVFGIGLTTNASPLFVVQFRGDLPGDPIQAQMRGANAAVNTAASYTGYTVNQWHHVVAVFRSASYRQIYVDGKAGTSETTTFATFTMNTMTIGTLVRTTPGLYADALISDVRLYSRDVGSEASYLYEQTREPFTPRRRVYFVPAAAVGNRRRRLLIGS